VTDDDAAPAVVLGKGPVKASTPVLDFKNLDADTPLLGAPPPRARPTPTSTPTPAPAMPAGAATAVAASTPVAAPDPAPRPVRRPRTRPAEAKAPRRRRGEPPEPPRPPDRTGIHLDASLRRRLKRFHRAQPIDGPSKTYTSIVLDALDYHYGDLGRLLPAPPSRGPGSHFEGRAPLRLQHDEDQVQITFRPAPNDLIHIDRLVDEHGATSRSTLIAVALDAYLTVMGVPPEPAETRS
jgi:hypothetical protein